MKQLNYELKQLCLRNRQGSYGTQDKRFHALQAIADDLYASGKKQINAHSLKVKWVYQLIDIRQGRGALSNGYTPIINSWCNRPSVFIGGGSGEMVSDNRIGHGEKGPVQGRGLFRLSGSDCPGNAVGYSQC